MIRRLAAAIAATAMLLGLSALPAAAQYDDDVSVSVSAATIEAGGTVEVEGSGFAPGSVVTATARRGGLVRQTQTDVADADGDVSFAFTLDRGGRWRIVLAGVNASGEAVKVSTRVLVEGRIRGRPPIRQAGAAAAAGRLADTGGSSTALWAGLGLVVAGGSAIAAARLRRPQN